jgi:hypothetical protein
LKRRQSGNAIRREEKPLEQKQCGHEFMCLVCNTVRVIMRDTNWWCRHVREGEVAERASREVKR